jgi:hypothetical protein
MLARKRAYPVMSEQTPGKIVQGIAFEGEQSGEHYRVIEFEDLSTEPGGGEEGRSPWFVFWRTLHQACTAQYPVTQT